MRAQDTIFVRTCKCTDLLCVGHFTILLSTFYFFLYVFLFASFVVIGFSLCYFILFVKINFEGYFLPFIGIKMLLEGVFPSIPNMFFTAFP